MNALQVADIKRKTRLHSDGDCVSMRPMRGYLNKLAGWGVAVMLAAFLPCAAQAAQVKDARVWAGPQYTRVVLDADGPLHYTIAQKDGRIVVRLQGFLKRDVDRIV